jgi:hypothetical protein
MGADKISYRMDHSKVITEQTDQMQNRLAENLLGM